MAAHACSINAVVIRLRNAFFTDTGTDSKDRLAAALAAEIDRMHLERMRCRHDNTWDLPASVTVRDFANRLVDELLHDHDHVIRVLEAAVEALGHTDLARPSTGSSDLCDLLRQSSW